MAMGRYVAHFVCLWDDIHTGSLLAESLQAMGRKRSPLAVTERKTGRLHCLHGACLPTFKQGNGLDDFQACTILICVGYI